MMSKERDLLKKWVTECMWRGSNMSLLEETKELLAQPEQEPVAWGVYDPDSDMLISIYGYKEKPDKVLKDRFKWVKLYAFPLTRKPLSDEEIYEIFSKNEWKTFIELARALEKAHDIGFDDE